MDNGRLASYDTATLELTSTVQTSGSCQGQNSAFNIATKKEPYYVISGSYGSRNGCGMSVATAEDGSFDGVKQSWLYEEVSNAHGLALQEVNGTELLYTADMGLNAIWVHSIDESGNAVVLQRVDLEEPGLKPRHMVIHPKGTYGYVSLEAANSLLALKLETSGLAAEEQDLERFPVLPEGTRGYISHRCMVSLTDFHRRKQRPVLVCRGKHLAQWSVPMVHHSGTRKQLRLHLVLPAGRRRICTQKDVYARNWGIRYGFKFGHGGTVER